MRHRRRLRQGLGATFREGGSNSRPFCLHCTKSERVRPRTGDHDEIDPLGDKPWGQAKTSPADALDAVARDRVPDLAGHDEAEPRAAGCGGAHRCCVARRDGDAALVGSLGLRDQKHEMRAGYPARTVLNAEIVGALANTRLLREAELRGRLLLENGDSEPSATLTAAVGEDLLAAARGHASAETMRAHAANVVGLVGAFHLGSAKKH